MTQELHPGWHPDPDSLGAFLEGVLPEHERERCLAHFAECAECREAMFLAGGPAAVEATPVAAERDRIPAWRRWLAPIPALSGAVAVGALAVAIFLLFFRTPAPQPRHEVARASRTTVVPRQPPRTVVQTPAAATKREKVTAPAPAAAPAPARSDQAEPLKVEVTGAEGLKGVVTDASNAVIPDAKVVLRDEATRDTRQTLSNSSGFFRFDDMPPGDYTLTVTAPGFTTWEERGIPVAAQQAWVTVPNIVLQVGGTKSEVAVVATNDVVTPTDTGQTSTSLNSHMITQFSLAGRDAAELIKIMPGMGSSSGLSKGGLSPGLTLKLEPSGALLISHDSGKSWGNVTPAWQGRAIHLALMVAPEPAASRPVFLLTTDAGAVWLSVDGIHWNAAPAHR